MTKITFTAPETIHVTNRAGQTVTVSTAPLNDSTLLALFEYGVTQKVNDAGSGALFAAILEHSDHDPAEMTADERKAWGDANKDHVVTMRETLRQECATNLEANVWGVTRATGRTADPLDAYRVALVLEIINRKPKSPLATEYKSIDSTDQKARYEYRLAFAKEHADVIDPVAQERLDAAQSQQDLLADLV